MAVGLWDFEPPVPEFVGLTIQQALAVCAANGIEVPRLIIDGSVGGVAWTADRRSDRLNLDVVAGHVVHAAYF